MATESATGRSSARERSYSTGFPVRCTDAEKREIFARAARAKRSASRFLVELAVRQEGEFEPFHASPEELSLLEGLVVQLRRVASNLSEVARRQHDSEYDQAQAPTRAEISTVVREVREALDQLRSLLA